MNFNNFRSLGKQNKTAAAIVKHLSQKLRSPKGGVIDLSHFRGKVRKTPGFSYQDYDDFWESLARSGFGKYIPVEEAGEHAKFIPSHDIIQFAKMASGKIPVTKDQDSYNQSNPASASTEGPVFQIATLIMKNLKQMSDKEIEFLTNLLNSSANFS